jgi:tRNA pseudouridine55 synthase
VLLVCIGKATKLAEELQSHDKEYVAGVTFGATTPSYDLEKEIDRFFPHEHISAESVENALPGFIGEQDQIAPLFSAKSVDGVRAYELARKLYKANSESSSEQNSELDTAAEQLLRVSKINITELELLNFAMGLASGESGFENRAPPLAAGGGAHVVGGVVLQTANTTREL